MKRLLLAIMILSSTALLAQKEGSKPYKVESLKGQKVDKVDVRTSGGSIKVFGGEGDNRVEIYVHGNNWKRSMRDDDIEDILQKDYHLEVGLSGGVLTALAERKKNTGWKNGLSISFHVYVDNEVDTDLRTSGGSINLTGLRGHQRFNTSGGGLRITDVRGEIDGKTSGGSIKLKNSHDNIDVTTSGGSITAEECTGTIHLGTSGGSLRLSDLTGEIDASTSGGSINGGHLDGSIFVRTSGGSIDLDHIKGGIEASTSGGSIYIDIEELSEEVDIHNSGGNIHVTMPMNKGIDLKLRGNKIESDRLSEFDGEISEDEIYGTLYGGGIPVSIRASSGKVRLSKAN